MKAFANITVLALVLGAFAQAANAQGVSTVANGVNAEPGAQAAADVVRSVAGSDFAFLGLDGGIES